MSAGFPQITDSNPVIAQEAFIFNVIMKVLTFVVVGMMVAPIFGNSKSFVSANEEAAGE